MVYALLKALHVLAVVLWVGGMAFAHFFLRPALATLEQMERRHIEEALARTAGVIKGPRGAARILGVPPSSLYAKMAKLGIGRPGAAG